MCVHKYDVFWLILWEHCVLFHAIIHRYCQVGLGCKDGIINLECIFYGCFTGFSVALLQHNLVGLTIHVLRSWISINAAKPELLSFFIPSLPPLVKTGQLHPQCNMFTDSLLLEGLTFSIFGVIIPEIRQEDYEKLPL